MEQAGEADAWDEKEFDTCFKEFDYDGSGEVNRQELLNFIKRLICFSSKKLYKRYKITKQS